MIKRRASAYMTVYLALTMGVMITLCLALIEGVRLNTLQMEAECISDLCMDSVMAEYHRELFRRYNILALDSTYGSKFKGRGNIEGRLAWYLEENFSMGKKSGKLQLTGYLIRDLLGMQLSSVSIEDYSLLSDWDGAVFRKEAVKAIKDDLGIIALQDTLTWLKVVEEYHLDTIDIEAQKQEADAQIAAYQGREIEGKPGKLEFDNPTLFIENTKKKGIMWLVLGDKSVSSKSFDPSRLIYQRSLSEQSNHGNIALDTQNVLQQSGEKLTFDEYLLSYFGNYLKSVEKSALDYEVEYFLVGKNTDADNLHGVLLRLLAIREAANATYLFSCKTKYEEAETVATVLSALIGVPELKDPFTITILLGWAYVESLYDLKVLMNGGRVPLMKDDKTWHYGFTGVLEGIWESVINSDQKEGLTYQDYLRILLSLANEKDVTGRAMNVVEANIRLTSGNQDFQMDACYARFSARVLLHSGYGYNLEIKEDKAY